MLVKIGKGIELDVDVERLPANVLSHVIYMGLRNVLMDAHANETETLTKVVDGNEVKTPNPQWKENSRAISVKKLESMYAGEVRTVTDRETDPVRQVALDIAERKARAEWKATAGKEDKFDNPRKRAADYLDKHPDIMEFAKAAMG